MTEAASNDALVATRRSLHQVAEHVLSAARKRATGHEIALVPGEGGVRTPSLPDGRVIALIDGDIAVIDDKGVQRPMTLADILFVLICIANREGIDLQQTFDRMMEKVERRDAGRWTPKR